MSKDDETPEKPTEEPKAAPKQRKIVRRSASTRDNPAFTEAPPTEAGSAAPADAAAPAPASADAPAAPAQASAGPASAGAPGARPRAVFDARAPRPRPQAGSQASPRTGEGGAAPRSRDGRPARPARGGDRGDYRPPPARPIGARPIPGGPRAPAREGSERSREHSGGDYRPPPARPIGARPIPGGPRAPMEERPRAPRPEGEARPPRPPREPRPEGHRPPHGHGPGPKPVQAAAPATAAQPKPVAPPPAPPPAAKPAPKPVPVFIPLARAGQVAPASAKPALTPKEALAAKTKAHAGKVVAKAPVSKPSTPSATLPAELVNVGADEAVAALVKAGDAAASLVDAWAAASNAAAIVEAAENEAAPGAARKAARRALNVLRARGVTIPARAKVAKVEERVEFAVEAELTPADASGVSSLTFTRRNATGRYHLAQVLVRDTVGIIQAASGWVSGSQLKEGKARVTESYGVPPVSVPLAWARARVAEARALNATSGFVLPLGLDGCRDLVEPAPEAAPPHPLADLEAEVTSDSAAAAARLSFQLHGEPEFASWMPDRGALQEMLAKVGERLGPEGLNDAAAVSAALEEEASAATDRFFSPEVRAIVAKRMRDAGISIRARNGDRAASDVLGVARAVVEAGLITSPPREIPFLVAFFQKGLNYLLREGGGRLRVPVAAAAPQPSEAPPA